MRDDRQRPARARLLKPVALGVGLVLALAAFAHWLVNRWSHVYVDDSRIAANVVTLSSEASGRVVEIRVVPGDQVKKGELLVQLERAPAELQLKEIDAEIARVTAEQGQLRAQQEMVRGRVESRRAAGRAQLESAEADHRAAVAELEAASSDYERLSALRGNGAVSAQVFERARARYLTAQQQELRAAAGIRTARAELAVREAEASEVEVLERQVGVLDAQKSALAAKRAQQLVDLGYREVRAAFDGVVDATFVDAGEYVSPGTRLLMYHDPRSVWVDANVKETDFGRLKTGAPAKVTVDAYPDRVFQGKVIRLGHAATSQFALLPNPNPSGNFTKVTQRLPVRIAIEQDNALLRPGMMVEVEIDADD